MKTKGEAIALAESIRFANRLQKVMKVRGFYELKEKWIQLNQPNLVEGKIVRNEERKCWNCNGEGVTEWSWYDECDECDRCMGTGVYSSRILYQHIFEIEGKRYNFHSYLEPKHLSESKGRDEKVFGNEFTKDELPLPPQSTLVEMVKIGLTLLEKAQT